MRLYCEVDVPFDKRSSRSISSHTPLQHTKKKTLYWIWVRTRASIPVSLDFVLSHLMENPDFDIGTCRLFCHIWLRIRAWIPVPLVFLLSHLVENLGIDLCTSRLFFVTSGGEPGTSRLSCHKYVVMLMNIQTTDSIIIKCNVFLQGKWNNCLLNFSLVLVTPRIFFLLSFCNNLWCLKL